MYACFIKKLRIHPVSFYSHSSNALGEPALILINPLGRSICLEKKYFMNVFITKLCLFWTAYLIPKQDIVFHGCTDANSNDALQYLMMLIVFQDGFYFFAVIWGFMFCFPCRSMRILLGNRPWALVCYHDFVKKEQIVKITTFWFLVIRGLHQNLRISVYVCKLIFVYWNDLNFNYTYAMCFC